MESISTYSFYVMDSKPLGSRFSERVDLTYQEAVDHARGLLTVWDTDCIRVRDHDLNYSFYVGEDL